MKLWDRKNRKRHHSNRIFDVVSYTYTSPDRKIEDEFFILETRDWVNVIPVTENGEAVLVKQYRHGLHDYSLELPGGIVDQGDPLDSAQRELQEETGCSSPDWHLLGKLSGNPAFLNNWNYSYLAENTVISGKQNLDKNEQIEVVTVPVELLEKYVQEGKIHHSMMIAILGLFFSSEIYKNKYNK